MLYVYITYTEELAKSAFGYQGLSSIPQIILSTSCL
jgi:hypothetical protein